jgi:hypothetical protein
MRADPIIVVTGLPRSGTSMLMQMLTAGGLTAVTDENRTADDDNPRGYFEYERVKELERDTSWLPEARGQAVKIITALLQHLPADHDYKVILVHRELSEVLASQRTMLERRGHPSPQSGDARMADLFTTHLAKIERFVENHPTMTLCRVEHRNGLENPLSLAASLNAFIGGNLDEPAMARAIDPTLHRQKA